MSRIHRVYGVDRLRVIDLSIFPHVTSGNTNAPVIMVAEKASDLIKLRWGYTDGILSAKRAGFLPRRADGSGNTRIANNSSSRTTS